MAESIIPIELKQLANDQLGIVWSDGHRSTYLVRSLRLNCRCANCVDEWTKEKRIRESEIPLDVRPKSIESVGRYALHFEWTDGHGTGYYTYDLLRQLCECEQCRSR
ncbi:MAG: DUF971 domain-containing protein [Deltaproteobacteria bacterium]|nr:DUF971 domain-containing protein [Deltaproteobacteria bacterium]